MMKRDRLLLLGNFALFQLLWFAAIFGAAAGTELPVFAVLAVLLIWGSLRGVPFGPDGRMILAGLVVGLAAEPVWLALGLIEYRMQGFGLLPPAWIMALWVGFAVSFNYSLAWLQGRPLLAGLFGAVGSALSVIAGVRFGAADAPQGLVFLAVVYAAGWAVLVPLLAWWAARGRPLLTGKGLSNGPRSLA